MQRHFYIWVYEKHQGPFSSTELLQFWSKGMIGPSTLIWYDDLSEYTEFERVSDQVIQINTEEKSFFSSLGHKMSGGLCANCNTAEATIRAENHRCVVQSAPIMRTRPEIKFGAEMPKERVPEPYVPKSIAQNEEVIVADDIWKLFRPICVIAFCLFFSLCRRGFVVTLRLQPK